MVNRFILNEKSYHGAGAIKEIATEVKKMGLKKGFICTDVDLVKYGVVVNVEKVLSDENLEYEIFDQVSPNPTVTNVQAGLKAFKEAKADYILAIGGGSPCDTAKAIGIIANNPEHEGVVTLEGEVDTKNKSVPILAVPTTAGTASEVTINYVITDTDADRKFVCVDTNSIPIAAFVDPDMMSTMPKGLSAATGMDALTHAIEGYITLGANEFSDMLHLKAIEIIARSLPKACENDAKARNDMALGQYIAGMGFSNVGLGAVHAMAHPLGAVYNTPHGIANAIILPTVMEYNAKVCAVKYREIAKAMGVKNTGNLNEIEATKAAINAVKNLAKVVDIPVNLKGIVKEKDIDFLAQSAYDDACRPGNPRDITKADFIKLYKSLI